MDERSKRLLTASKFKNWIACNYTIINEINILNTGGGIKNSIKYFNNENLIVTNSDIFWDENNKQDVMDFIQDIDNIEACSILLLQKINAIGLNKDKGDFILEHSLIKRWIDNNPILYYSGLQIINPNIWVNISHRLTNLLK